MIVVEEPVPIPEMSVLKTDIFPTIDGEEDVAWNRVEWSTPFVTYDLGKKTANETRVKVMQDDKYLYVLYRAEEKDISGMQVITGARDTRVYLGDSVEFFVRPDETRDDYFHFVISPDGTVFDEAGFDSKWNGFIDVGAKVSEDYWSVEIKLDLEELMIDRFGYLFFQE